MSSFERSTTSPVLQPSTAPSPALADLWRTLQNAIRARVQPEQFETWFRRATLVHADGEQVRLAVQNGFTRDWLTSYYRDVLDQAIQQTLGGPAASSSSSIPS